MVPDQGGVEIRPTARTVLVSVVALVLVTAAGVTGYLTTRARDPERAATTVRIDGTDHPCGRRGRFTVGMTVTGPGDVRFAVDGVEVPARRTPASGYGPATSAALLPEPLRLLRCDDGVPHRLTALTGPPSRCSWGVTSEQSLDEARQKEYDLAVSGTECTVTVVD